MKKLLAVLLMLCLATSTVSGAWSEILQVVVKDQNDYPVANIPVTVEYQKNTFLAPVEVEELDPDAFGENVDPSKVSIKIERFDLSKIDGKITGVTNAEGIFETEVRNFVPALNATDQYIVTVLGEERRVVYNDNIINGKHVEFFRHSGSLSKLPIRVRDHAGQPLEGALVKALCWAGNNITTDEEGMAVIYPEQGKCTITASYGIFKTEATVEVEPEEIVQLKVVKEGQAFRMEVLDEKGSPIDPINFTLRVNGEELALSKKATVSVPSGIAYGSNAGVSVRTSTGRSQYKNMQMNNRTERFVMPTNPMLEMQILNYNSSLTIITVDENGAPLENVLIYMPDGETIVSGADGIIEIEEVYNESLDLTAFFAGVNRTVSVNMSEGDTLVTLEFKRNPLEVVVESINHTYDQGCSVLIIGRVYEPRLVDPSRATVAIHYYFENEAVEFRQVGVEHDGLTNDIRIACPAVLPATLTYWFEASSPYGEFTSQEMRYAVPEKPPITSAGEAFSEAVEAVEQVTGSETTALLIVTLVLLAFIIVVSVAAMTALMHRKKLKKMVGGKGEDERKPPPLPKI